MSSARSIPNHIGKERRTASQSPGRSKSGPMISMRDYPVQSVTRPLPSAIMVRSSKYFRFVDQV